MKKITFYSKKQLQSEDTEGEKSYQKIEGYETL